MNGSLTSARARLVVSAVLLLVFIPTLATGAPQTSEPAATVSLEALLALALQSNPELQAADRREQAAGTRPGRADTLPDPTLALIVRNVGFPELTLGSEMMSVFGARFSQAIPAKGKRPNARLVAERGVQVAHARTDSARRRLAQQITSAYFDLLRVLETTGIVQETRELLVDLEATAQARYAVGEGIQQDVFKAQVEISVLLNRLVQLEQARATLEATINRLIGRPSNTPLGRPASRELRLEPLDMDGLVPEAVRGSAALQLRTTLIEEQSAAVELARADRRPDWVLSGSYLNRGTLPGIWELNVGITLPIRKSQRQDLAIEDNEHELEARRSDHNDVARAVELAVHDSYLQADRAIRLSRLYRDAIIPQAVLSLESALAGYGVGNVDFLTVLDNVVTLLTYRVELANERTSYATAVAQIEEHLGRSLGVTPGYVLRGEVAQSRSPDRPAGAAIPTISGGHR